MNAISLSLAEALGRLLVPVFTHNVGVGSTRQANFPKLAIGFQQKVLERLAVRLHEVEAF